MDEVEFPCRTKVVSRSIYRIKIYSFGGVLHASTSEQTQDAANKYVDNMSKLFPNKYRFEIIPEHWDELVCIECGREKLGW